MWNTNGGYEYNAVLMAAAFGITAAGPGRWSLDALRGRERWGDGWAVAELAGALAGSALAVEVGRRLKQRDESQQQQQQQQAPAAAQAEDARVGASLDGQPTPVAA